MIKKLLIIKYSNMDIKLDINPDKAADLYNDKDFIIDKIRKLDVQYATDKAKFINQYRLNIENILKTTVSAYENSDDIDDDLRSNDIDSLSDVISTISTELKKYDKNIIDGKNLRESENKNILELRKKRNDLLKKNASDNEINAINVFWKNVNSDVTKKTTESANKKKYITASSERTTDELQQNINALNGKRSKSLTDSLNLFKFQKQLSELQLENHYEIIKIDTTSGNNISLFYGTLITNITNNKSMSSTQKKIQLAELNNKKTQINNSTNTIKKESAKFISNTKTKIAKLQKDITTHENKITTQNNNSDIALLNKFNKSMNTKITKLTTDFSLNITKNENALNDKVDNFEKILKSKNNLRLLKYQTEDQITDTKIQSSDEKHNIYIKYFDGLINERSIFMKNMKNASFFAYGKKKLPFKDIIDKKITASSSTQKQINEVIYENNNIINETHAEKNTKIKNFNKITNARQTDLENILKKRKDETMVLLDQIIKNKNDRNKNANDILKNKISENKNPLNDYGFEKLYYESVNLSGNTAIQKLQVIKNDIAKLSSIGGAKPSTVISDIDNRSKKISAELTTNSKSLNKLNADNDKKNDKKNDKN